MPSLKAIRKRIASVKNTKKITAAMKLVAGARLRRAQEGIVAARPYAARMQEVIAELAARTGSETHPLLAHRDARSVAVILLTSDRGLCGAFNSNVSRRTERFVIDNGDFSAIDIRGAAGSDKSTRFTSVKLNIVGRKGKEYFRRRPSKISSVQREWAAPATALQAQALAQEIAATVMADFLVPPPNENGEQGAAAIDAVYIVYNEFKSAISQNVVVVPLLPVMPAVLDDSFGNNDFLYEPSRDELLSHLVPLFVQSQIYRGLLESIASEFGARMSAMDSATKNASEMIGSLTLQFNRARQAAITKELMEIIGGAEALKG